MRKKYYTSEYIKNCTLSHIPFFKISSKYLPSNRNSLIIDIGSGNGSFATYCNTSDKYMNLYLLDGNPVTVSKLKKKI